MVIKYCLKAPFLSYRHPSPRRGRIATAVISVTCPLWGKVGRQPGKRALNYAVLTR